MKKIVFYHSKPEFILHGQSFMLSTVLRQPVTEDVFAFVCVNGKEEKINLRKTSEKHYGENDFAVYGVELPEEFFADVDELKYKFACGEYESCEYSVSVDYIGKIPPLAISEFYARPKGLDVTLFIEVMNPSESAVDAYDYKFMVYSGEECSADSYLCELALSGSKETDIIKPGEVAAIWPLLPKNHSLDADGKYLTVDGFVGAAMSDFPKPEFDLYAERDSMRVIPVEASTFDEKSGKFLPLWHLERLPVKTERATIIIAPRDATPENGDALSIYKMVYNRKDDGDRDTPVRHSSLWSIDVRYPKEGIAICHRALMTPGRLAKKQAIPRADSPVPVIIPFDTEVKKSNKDGGVDISFGIASGTPADAYIELKTRDGKTCRYDAERDCDGIYHINLAENEIFGLKKLDYTVNVYDGLRRTSLGTTSKPLSCQINDERGPYIISLFPTEKYCFDNTKTPELRVTFFDISRTDLSGSILCVDKKNVSREAKWSDGEVVYTPAKSLSYGEHSFEIMLRDNLGNKTYRKVNFSICRPGKLNFYRGEVHSHTADSDGTAGPREAIEYARDVGKVDFFAVTEHSHYMKYENYKMQINVSNSYNIPGKFVSIYGFEMTWNNTCALWGHMNILNSEWYDEDIKGDGIPEIYEKLSRDKNAVAMFNHPGLPWGNFHDFDDYTSDADRAVCLAEIKGAGYDREYMDMLAMGWHTAPAFNEDNHGYNWTTANAATTYALAPALTRENILDAFRRRRTYMTTDPTMKIAFRVNGEWMGARLQNPSKLNVEVNITTEAEEGIGNIALVGEDNIIIATVNAGVRKEFGWKVTVAPDFDYYYLKITSPGRYAVTAPVWIEGRDMLNIRSLDFALSDDDYKPNVLTAKIKNESGSDARAVNVDFYLTGIGGFDKDRTAPYQTVTVPTIAKGRTVSVRCAFPNIAGVRRASVIVHGMCGIKRAADTSMRILSPVKIAEILPKSAPAVDCNGTKYENPFPYFKLCNLSNRDITLDGYYTRLWVTTGKQPPESRMLKLNGYTIKAGGILTVWVRPADSCFDVEDFNRHYGVMLTEGEELVVTEVKAISASNEARRLELMYDKETLARAEYNFKQKPGADINEGKAITFDIAPSFTGTSAIISNKANPSPAKNI